MKVICKENKAKNLDLNEVTILDSKETEFPVEKEQEYIVMGIMMLKESNCIYYLVNRSDRPDWIPYPLFNIIYNEFPPNWFIKIFDKKESFGDLFYLSGFYELCNNEDYHDALIEREKWALDIYFKRKSEVEEWYSDKYWLSWSKK